MSKRERETELAADDTPNKKQDRKVAPVKPRSHLPTLGAESASTTLALCTSPRCGSSLQPGAVQSEALKPAGPANYPPGYEIPNGWLNCPPFGHNLRPPKEREGGIIPCKVPLGEKFNPYIPSEKQCTPSKLVDQLARKAYTVGLVIDLTFSWRYYDPAEFHERNADHMKIRCRGRDEVPDPEVVNKFCFEVLKFKREQLMKRMQADKEGEDYKIQHVVVHCTHGFNRTGYMLVNWMIRHEEQSVASAIKTFANFRPPGIYKDSYIHQLFKYNHELRPASMLTPQVPDWKQEGEPDAPDEMDLTAEDLIVTAEGTDMHHDDTLGEEVPEEEAAFVQGFVAERVMRQQYQEGMHLRFPGSQPVSLARSNLGLLNQQRYWVTWKADGTRYLLLACEWGVYLMDRTFRVRRVQMRFPHADMKTRHHNTLLDGEMVVDEDLETGKQVRRFLAYDLLLLHGKDLLDYPFEDRWRKMEEHVMKPRMVERFKLEEAKHHKKPLSFLYCYNEEPFRVRRKDFWPLPFAGKLLNDFIPQLSHECDGLIFQGAEDKYEVGTCNELLKWKFAHLNSVDFLLRISPAHEKQLALLEARRSHGGGPNHFVILPGAKIDIDDEAARQWVDTVIECTWDKEQQTWRFLRERKDKETPNAFHVYEKVMKSIEDDINEGVLLEAIGEALQNEVYAKDRNTHRKS